MAGPLTEVVLQVRLPAGPLRDAMQRSPGARLVLTPVGQDGSVRTTRWLVSADGFASDALDAVEALLERPTTVARDDHHAHYVGVPRPALAARLESIAGEALLGPGKDLVWRPALVADGWIHIALVAPHPGATEASVGRAVFHLAEHGHEARLVRIAPFLPTAAAAAFYEEALTPKQVEFLRVALAMGLYDTPRRCTLDDLAALFGISKAAAHNRAKGAERRLIARYFA